MYKVKKIDSENKEFDLKKYKLSIIVPTFNGGNTLIGLINSIREQYDRDCYSVQVIFVDDGSTDGTKDILSSLSEPFFVYFNSHQGVSEARNYGINMSRGEYITFCDQDDNISNDYLKTIFSDIKSGEDFYVYSKIYNFVHENKAVQYKYNNELLSKDDAVDCLFESKPPQLFATVWNCIYKASVVKTNSIFFDPLLLHGSEDTAYNIDFLSHIKNEIISSKIVYRYNIYENGNTIKEANDSAIEDLRVLMKHIEKLNIDDDTERFFCFRLFMHTYVKALKGKHLTLKRKLEVINRLIEVGNNNGEYRVRFQLGSVKNAFYYVLSLLLALNNRYANLLAFELFRCAYIVFSPIGL